MSQCLRILGVPGCIFLSEMVLIGAACHQSSVQQGARYCLKGACDPLRGSGGGLVTVSILADVLTLFIGRPELRSDG